MKLIKLIIFVLALSGSECHFGITKDTSDSDKSTRLAEAAVISLLSCYENEVVTVGAAGVSERILHKILSEQSIPVALVDNDAARIGVEPQIVDKGSRHKLQLFVVEASSSQQLERILIRVKYSKWWNPMATYLIIDWPSQKNQVGCSTAFNHLWTAWNKDILNALYVCLDKFEEKLLIYSYNPYTSRAPQPWRLENTYKGNKGTMFVQEYRPDQLEICKNLNFDKTTPKKML